MLDVIDRPEFQEFLLYMSQDQTFPLRGVISKASIEDSIIQEADRLHAELVEEIKVYAQNWSHRPCQLMPNQRSPGNPCFTFDFSRRDGSCPSNGLLATTVHWRTEAANGDLLVKSQLVSIKYIKEQWHHSVARGIAEEFLCTGTYLVGGHGNT